MISTIIPVHNTNPDWLVQSVKSILDQDFPFPIEILLIDDASSNKETLMALEALREIDNIRIITLNENLGISGALNLGISNSKYDIIARMDSDDYSLPNRFQAQFDYLVNNPDVDLVGSNLSYLVLHEGEWTSTQQATDHPQEITREIGKNSLWFLNHPTVMFRKQSVIDVGGYDESLRGLAEDFELWIRMLKEEKTLRNLPDNHLLLRINPDSLMANIKQENHEFQLKLQSSL